MKCMIEIQNWANWSRPVFLFKEVVIAAGSTATGEIGNVLTGIRKINNEKYI